MVPMWNRLQKYLRGLGSNVDPFSLVVPIWAGSFLAYGHFLLPVMATWVGVLVDEGYTQHGAQRFLRGEWPYRDFFFLWSPGVILLHGWVQEHFPSWERGLPLWAATLNGSLLLWLGINKSQIRGHFLLLLAALLFLWNFPLWNVTYSSWFALTPVLMAGLLGPRRMFLVGICLGIAILWKQNMGLLPLALISIYLLLQIRLWDLFRLWIGAALGFVPILLFMAHQAGPGWLSPALQQIFLFPFTYREHMALPLSLESLAPWLTLFGFWLGGLFFARVQRQFLFTGLVIWAVLNFSRQGFQLGSESFFQFVSLTSWLPPLFYWKRLSDHLRLFYFLSLGAFLQVYPRFDFQHFLFVFPLVAFWLSYGLAHLPTLGPRLSARWLALPSLLLLVIGMGRNAEVLGLRFMGQPDPLGFISFGYAHRIAREFQEVRSHLLERGLKEGEPILVLPNATKFYSWSGFRNVTPYDQFFPSYVEAYGGRQIDVLPLYEARGGRWLLLSPWAGVEKFTPVLERHIQVRYKMVKLWPNMWSLWEKRPLPEAVRVRRDYGKKR
jgi:hypothetical protein